MYAGAESPHNQRRVAFGRGDLATPPGMDHRNGKTTTESVNQFQTIFLSELVLHYTFDVSDPTKPTFDSEVNLATGGDSVRRF